MKCSDIRAILTTCVFSTQVIRIAELRATLFSVWMVLVETEHAMPDDHVHDPEPLNYSFLKALGFEI